LPKVKLLGEAHRYTLPSRSSDGIFTFFVTEKRKDFGVPKGIWLVFQDVEA
jgi:hypothetical protein